MLLPQSLHSGVFLSTTTSCCVRLTSSPISQVLRPLWSSISQTSTSAPFYTPTVVLIDKKLLLVKVGAKYSFSCFGSFNYRRVRNFSFGSITSFPIPLRQANVLGKFLAGIISGASRKPRCLASISFSPLNTSEQRTIISASDGPPDSKIRFRHHRLPKFKIIPHALQSFSSHAFLSLL